GGFLLFGGGGGGGGGPPPPPTTPGTGTSTARSGVPATLDEADPCGLLAEDEVEQVFGPIEVTPTRDDFGSASSCRYEPGGRYLTIDVRTNAGLADLPATNPMSDLTVGDHEAKSWVSTGGSCFVALGVSSSSRVDIGLKAGQGEDPCPFTHRLAGLVEPRLP
ncbi:DUF3558 family protein, partial [Actinosynnema sp. NPDC059797]